MSKFYMGSGLSLAGNRIEQLQDHLFTGRHHELKTLLHQLANQADAWTIINVSGEGGIGKTALLKALVRRHSGQFVFIDGRTAHGKQTFLNTFARQLNTDPHLGQCIAALETSGATILAIDHYFNLETIDLWIRNQVIPFLPATVLPVIATRVPLKRQWRKASSWLKLLKSIHLQPFDLEETEAFFARHGLQLSQSVIEAVWHRTNGHPQALSLLASHMEPGGKLGQRSCHTVLSTLADTWLVETASSDQHRLAEALAIVPAFNQDLAEHVAAQPVDTAPFQQFTHLSFVRPRKDGWSIDPLVRDVIVTQLRKRSHQRFSDYRQRALKFALQAASDPSRRKETRAWGLTLLIYLLQDSLLTPLYFGYQYSDTRIPPVTSAHPGDLDSIMAYLKTREERARRQGKTTMIVNRRNLTSFEYRVDPGSLVKEHSAIDFEYLLQEMPGAVKLVRRNGQISGLVVIIPVNKETLPWLRDQRETGVFFQEFAPAVPAGHQAPPSENQSYFIRYVDCVPGDYPTLAALARTMLQLALDQGRLFATSPVGFWQEVFKHHGAKPISQDSPGKAGGLQPFYTMDFTHGGLQKLIEASLRHVNEHDLAKLVKNQVVDEEEAGKPGSEQSTGSPAKPAGETLEALTPRQREVALAVKEGLSNAEVAKKLFISEGTVKRHLTNVYRRLGVRRRSELIATLIRGEDTHRQA